jgi:sugar lactone lactonase YvrE
VTTTVKAKHFLAVQCRLGEGPRWHPDERRLYWLDIEQHGLYRLDPASGQPPERFDVGLPVGCLAFRQRGGLVLATRDGYAFWDAEAQHLDFIADPEADRPEARFNDGSVDSRGRFWAGTMTHKGAENALYRLDPDGTVHIMERGLTISNGLGWSLDGRTMYLTDTNRSVIHAYDYDEPSGTVTKRRTFVQVPVKEGYPDGLAVDSQGYVWSAHYGGSRVTRYDPDGKVERVVEVPVPNVTACTFGGPDLTTLYITTAWSGMTDAQRAEHPRSGDLFVLETGISGTPEHKFAG